MLVTEAVGTQINSGAGALQIGAVSGNLTVFHITQQIQHHSCQALNTGDGNGIPRCGLLVALVENQKPSEPYGVLWEMAQRSRERLQKARERKKKQ